MRTSESLSQIAPALVDALGEIEGAEKRGNNTHFKSQYATLEAVIGASREVLTRHNLALMQFPGALEGGTLSLETVIIHASGEWVSGDFQIALGKVDPQGVGSALTYARRYAQKAALNIPDVDDDAEAAVGRGPDAKPPHPKLDVAPLGPDFWNCDGPGMTASAAKKAGMDLIHDGMRTAISEIHSATAMREWIEANLEDIRKMPRSWRAVLREDCELKREEFGPTENDRRAARWPLN